MTVTVTVTVDRMALVAAHPCDQSRLWPRGDGTMPQEQDAVYGGASAVDHLSGVNQPCHDTTSWVQATSSVVWWFSHYRVLPSGVYLSSQIYSWNCQDVIVFAPSNTIDEHASCDNLNMMPLTHPDAIALCHVPWHRGKSWKGVPLTRIRS